MASVRCPPVIQPHRPPRPLLPSCPSSLIDHSSPPARSHPEALQILYRLPSSYIRFHARAILDAIRCLRLVPDVAIKPVVLDLLPHKFRPPSRLPSRYHTTLSPSHQPRLSQCSPILRYLWREQRFFFLQDPDRHFSALEIFWCFGIRVEELSFLGRRGETGGWLGRRKWRGRGGEDGSGEIGGKGRFAGGFGLGLRLVLGGRDAGLCFGVFGEPLGG